MSKSLRDQLEHSTKKAEMEIKKVLQSFHDETGMIPVSLSFERIDVRNHMSPAEDDERTLLIGDVHLKANT